MKTITLLAAIIVLGFGLGCSPVHFDTRVEIGGDPGIAFQCWYATTWYGADSVYGTTPHSFDVKMRRKLGAIAVSIYRENSPGLLWAKLYVDGVVRDADSTTSDPGGISLGWSTTE